MLTARHAVEGCTQVVVTKERWRIAARVVATSARFDLALIKAPRTLGLSAVFPRSQTAGLNDMFSPVPSKPWPGSSRWEGC
jgi:S1-C subfamily serine protease